MITMNKLNTQETHFTKTRKAQRLTVKLLKRVFGLKVVATRTKHVLGWKLSVPSLSRPLKSVCVSPSGRLIPVITLTR